MRVLAVVAAAVATLAGGSGGAPVAAADDGFAGQYAYYAPAAEGDDGFETTWTVTGCGTDCVHVRSAPGDTDADAHRSGRIWLMQRYDERGAVCDNGEVHAATIRYSIDATTLRGRLRPDCEACGGIMRARPFYLVRLG